MTAQKPVTVEAAVKRELDGIKGADLSPALYALALADARLIDITMGARDKASLSKELREVRAELHALADARTEVGTVDAVDEIAAARDARLAERAARRAAAAGP